MYELTEEQERLVLDNKKIVYYLVNKWGVNQSDPKYDDLVQSGMIGLTKAARTFDASKNIKFSSYAGQCISNELGMYHRRNKKYANNISLDEPIAEDSDGNKTTLHDVLPDKNSDFIKYIENRLAAEKSFSIILNCLQRRERTIMLYMLGGKTQHEMADTLGISQSYISRLVVKITNKVKRLTESQVDYKEVFSMAIVGDAYRISFASRDVSNFNKIFATLLKNLTTTEGLPDFKVSCNKERIIIQVPAHPESFSFIAQIIGKIDDFSMTFVSDSSSQPESEATQKEEKTDDGDGSKENETTLEDESARQTSPEEITTVEVSQEKKRNSSKRKKSKAQQVIQYILGLESFTAAEIKKEFPDFKPSDISNALYTAKKEGLVTSLDKGTYKVNK